MNRTWTIDSAEANSTYLEECLGRGYEPFAVTTEPEYETKREYTDCGRKMSCIQVPCGTTAIIWLRYL